MKLVGVPTMNIHHPRVPEIQIINRTTLVGFRNRSERRYWFRVLLFLRTYVLHLLHSLLLLLKLPHSNGCRVKTSTNVRSSSSFLRILSIVLVRLPVLRLNVSTHPLLLILSILFFLFVIFLEHDLHYCIQKEDDYTNRVNWHKYPHGALSPLLSWGWHSRT